MIVYPADQVTAVTDPDARRVLTERGLPEAHITSFRPAPVLRPFDGDPRFVVIGMWDIDRVPICLNQADGEVVCAAPGRAQLYPVNTTLRAFVDSLDAIDAAAPLSTDNPAYDSYDAAAEHVRSALASIDPQAMDDAAGFWQTIIDDIANGDYDESP